MTLHQSSKGAAKLSISAVAGAGQREGREVENKAKPMIVAPERPLYYNYKLSTRLPNVACIVFVEMTEKSTKSLGS
jgi:hypothetical protein